MSVSCIDLFCGVGGLTHGLSLEGVRVKAGIDVDPACRYPYEVNNDARFLERDISEITASEISKLVNLHLKLTRDLHRTLTRLFSQIMA